MNDKILAKKDYHKKYREEHKEQLKLKWKQYRLNNKKAIQLKDKNYYQTNKNIIRKKAKEKYRQKKYGIILPEEKKTEFKNHPGAQHFN